MTKRKTRPFVKGPIMEQRKTRRIPVACGLYFHNNRDKDGEAQLYDVSLTGCQAESSVDVEVGMEFQLSLDLLDYPWPLRIEKAIVRWVNGLTFGLEFVEVFPAQKERLRSLTMGEESSPRRIWIADPD